MDMIRHTSYTKHIATSGVYQLADVAMQSFQMLFAYARALGSHMENDMQIYLTK